MGQYVSQDQGEEGYSPNDGGILKQEQEQEQEQPQNRQPVSDELVFSSQVHNFASPTLPPAHSFLAFSTPMDIGTDADAESSPPLDTLTHSRRAMKKKKKRESRRAAKLAEQQQQEQEQQQAYSQENAEEPSRFAEIWDSQERLMAAKREPVEEEEQEPEAQTEEVLVEHQSTSSKKRKRRSRNQADTHEKGSKKRKNSYSVEVGITTEHNKSARIDGLEGPEDSSDINFNDIAEQLYSGRKRKSHRDMIGELSEPSVEIEPQHEESSRVIDLGDQVKGDPYRDEPGEDETAARVEMYGGGDINHIYNNVDNVDVPSEEPSTGHITATDQLSSSARESNGLTHDAHTSGLVIDDVEQGIDTAVVPSPSGSNSDGYVEIPSSVPHPTSVGEPSTMRSTSSKTGTGRKRVVKKDFFSRTIDNMDENTNSQSPSTAALSRRKGKGKGKETAGLEDETQATPRATPRTTNGEADQPRISSTQTPKTPATLSGAFSEFEIRNLSQAIEQFKNDHNMTQYQVNELIQRNPKESKAVELWECIMATCPDRSRQKVINQTRRRFHNFVARGTWTPEQQQELREMYEQYGNKYARIGQIINRHPEDIRDRIRNYIVCGDNLKKDQWSEEEIDRLIAIVEQAVIEIRHQRAKRGQNGDLPVEEDINWQMVSQGMGRTRSRLQCIAKWKAIKPQLTGGGLDGETSPLEEIIQQARETATTMSFRNRSLVVKEILKSGAKADSRIPWVKIRHELGDQWTRTPLMVVWYRLRRTVPNWQGLNVKEICTFLLQHFQLSHKLEYPSEESGDLDFEAEYREIESRIKRGRKSNIAPKSAAFISKASDDEEEEGEEEEKAQETVRNQLDGTDEEGVEQAEAATRASRGHRSYSVDLGIGSSSEEVREVEDSEPEANTHSRRRRRRRHTRSGVTRSKPKYSWQDESDDQSSDTNASQVSSIPAR
ncbi:hypothetical protein F5Y10DRAFT_213039 [Nemania abortiva]|nr:hypothetical protein F5Y10DRAFT_213039 [Nemania abortiva]